MSELTIEQKAKLYDEVVERAKKWYNAPNVNKIPTFGNKIIEDIFPELKEPEDEQIRKELIDYLKERKSGESYGQYVLRYDRWINWLEKQSKQSSNILWHDVSEEPEEQRELFCEWKGYTGVWYDVAFYHPSNKTFWNGEQQIENVVKWAYIDEMLEEQPQSQIKPKFKAGDTIQCISDKTDKRTIAEIDTLYNVYRCENNYPIPFTQENMWKLI